MHMLTRLAAVSLAFAAAPVLAGSPAPQAAPAVAGTPVAQNDIDKKDPMICERVTEIGSRLRAKKICMTKSQWEEQRRGDRSNIERSQIQRGMDPVG
ncbi:MAG: hypothetical protein J7493_02680 [Porphyrobacter sp.]|nr:hypothetical protein [Porphyrobacter sp.]